MSIAVIALAVVWAGFIAYVALGGADFGAGAWDLLASGPTAQRQHRFISRVLGPVWEANHVWLIFLLVGLMNLFPSAYATLMSALFLPLMLALLGIVLRGAGFVFRTHAFSTEGRSARLWSRIFSISSVLTPCFLGISAAAVASGRVGPGLSQADLLSGWITPFSLTVGVMATLQCATLAAVYLTAEAHHQGETDFVLSYRLKALISSVLVSAGTAVPGPLRERGALALARPAGARAGISRRNLRAGSARFGLPAPETLPPCQPVRGPGDSATTDLLGGVAVSLSDSTSPYH
jgi:cytochrome d ubiquinol oxidase subunit II